MHPCFVTEKVFKYAKSNGPLFVIPARSNEESDRWNEVMVSQSREFHIRSKLPGITHDSILSSGTTFGEFAIHIMSTTHKNRLTRQ